jgi:hypothetical protein
LCRFLLLLDGFDIALKARRSMPRLVRDPATLCRESNPHIPKAIRRVWQHRFEYGLASGALSMMATLSAWSLEPQLADTCCRLVDSQLLRPPASPQCKLCQCLARPERRPS